MTESMDYAYQLIRIGHSCRTTGCQMSPRRFDDNLLPRLELA